MACASSGFAPPTHKTHTDTQTQPRTHNIQDTHNKQCTTTHIHRHAHTTNNPHRHTQIDTRTHTHPNRKGPVIEAKTHNRSTAATTHKPHAKKNEGVAHQGAMDAMSMMPKNEVM